MMFCTFTSGFCEAFVVLTTEKKGAKIAQRIAAVVTLTFFVESAWRWLSEVWWQGRRRRRKILLMCLLDAERLIGP